MAEKQVPRLFLSKFTKTIEHPGSRSICIISATDEGVIVGADSQLGGLLDSHPGGIHIFTERLVLNPYVDQTAPTFASHVSQFFMLAAGELEVNGPLPATLSVSGAAGTPNVGGGSDGDSATHGAAGNTLNLYLQRIPSQTLPIKWEAKGGNGATTANLAIAAGSGGNGGRINLIGHFNATEVLRRLDEYSLTWKLPSRWTDKNETAADEIPRDDLKVSELVDILQLARFMLPSSTDQELRNQVTSALEGVLGAAKRTIYTITAAVNEAISSITDAIENQRLTLIKSCVVTGGNGGSAKLDSGKDGINGRPGSTGDRSVEITTGTSFAQAPGFIFVHPLQCEMLLEKARVYFYFGDKTSCDRAEQTLHSLVQKVTALLNQPDVALVQTWTLFEKQKQIFGLPSVAELPKRFNSILKEAKSLLFQLTCTNIDYYSLRKDWIPRFTAATFDEETDKYLAHLADLETTYSDYIAALDANKVSTQMREQLVSRSHTTQAGISAQTGQLEENLSLLKTRINDPEFNVKARELRHDVDWALKELKEEVKFTFRLSLEQITEAAVSFASEPSKGAAAKAGGKLAWDAITKVPDGDGKGIDKSLLLSGVDSISGNLQEKIGDIATSKMSGEMSGLEKNGKMLVGQQEALEKLFKSFSSAPFAAKVKLAINLVKSYVDLVTKRNADIVEYNFTLKAIIETQTKQAGLAQDRTVLQKQGATAPSLSQISLMTAMIDGMYTTSRARVMKLISYYRRAINFSSLTEPDMLSLGGFGSEAALNLTGQQLHHMKSELRSQLFDLQNQRGSDVNPFPHDYDKAPGKNFSLSPAQMKRLLERGTLDVDVPPVFRSYSGPSKEFAGCADVRVHRARFYLDGVKASATATDQKPLVQIALRHSGDNTFVDVNNRVHHFRHNPISFSWSYRLKGNKVVQAVDSGVLVHFKPNDREGGKAYAAPSPFTTWTISLEYLAREDLDLSEVTGGRFEFFGTSRSFVGST